MTKIQHLKSTEMERLTRRNTNPHRGPPNTGDSLQRTATSDENTTIEIEQKDKKKPRRQLHQISKASRCDIIRIEQVKQQPINNTIQFTKQVRRRDLRHTFKSKWQRNYCGSRYKSKLTESRALRTKNPRGTRRCHHYLNDIRHIGARPSARQKYIPKSA